MEVLLISEVIPGHAANDPTKKTPDKAGVFYFYSTSGIIEFQVFSSPEV